MNNAFNRFPAKITSSKSKSEKSLEKEFRRQYLDPGLEDLYSEGSFYALFKEVDLFFHQYYDQRTLKLSSRTSDFIKQRLEITLNAIYEAAPKVKERFFTSLPFLNSDHKKTAFFVIGCLKKLEDDPNRIFTVLEEFEEKGPDSIIRFIDLAKDSLSNNTPSSGKSEA